jgi:16S rRNA (guanine1207-N2)-methyltransferase
MVGAGSHYFDEQPAVGSAPDLVDLALPDLHLRLATDRGVFSHGRIDAGTKLLLLRAPPPPSAGDLLDLGCGAGPIALTMARRAPDATVWAVDVNARARDLCARNASANGIANVRVAAPDDVPPAVRLATIWSNPPIRIGKAALHSLLATWLGRLRPDGVAHLVVHKHLGADSLQRWLTEQGFATTRLASSAGYRILRSARRVDGDAQA